MKKSMFLSLLLHVTAIAAAFVARGAPVSTTAERLPFQVSFSASPEQVVPTPPPPPEPVDPVDPHSDESPIELDTIDLDPVEFDPVVVWRVPLVNAPMTKLTARLPRPLRIANPQVVQPAPVDAPAAHVDAPPQPQTCPPPLYPALARRLGHEGTVKVRVTISAAGAVTRAEVQQSSGSHILDKAALYAVRTWTFRPASRNGRSIAGTLIQPVVFRLG